MKSRYPQGRPVKWLLCFSCTVFVLVFVWLYGRGQYPSNQPLVIPPVAYSAAGDSLQDNIVRRYNELIESSGITRLYSLVSRHGGI
jgi:hypothetical protein